VTTSRIAFGVVVGIAVAWVLFPGIFDSRSPSIFGSEHRRSPLVELTGPKTLVDESISVKEDQFGGFTFELTVPTEVSLTVTHTKGPRFEVYVVEKKGYDEFKAAANSLFGGKFHHFEDFAGTVSKKDPVYHRKGALRAGTYVAMIDNSDFGDVSPPANFSDDVVTAKMKIVLE
jgi:hypothetical protein